MCGMVVVRMPGPESATSRVTCPSSRAAETTMAVPAGVCTSALSSRMRMHLGDALGVAVDLDRVGAARTPARRRARGRGRELAGDLARELADVGRLGPQLQRPRLQPGEVEQLRGELAHASDLPAQLREELRARLVVELLVLEQLEEAAEREDRRAQLVRGRGDELLARRVEPRELALHVVERAREPSELVVGVGVDRVGEVARGDLARRLLEPLDACRQPRATR